MVEPFDNYPGGGRVLLGRARDSANCRHGYGLEFLRATGQSACAYCGRSLLASYEAWLTMQLDHVVPEKAAVGLGIPREWWDDTANKVLACAACNAFDNRYALPPAALLPTSLDEFFELRDRTFRVRWETVVACHQTERAFYESGPWRHGSGTPNAG